MGVRPWTSGNEDRGLILPVVISMLRGVGRRGSAKEGIKLMGSSIQRIVAGVVLVAGLLWAGDVFAQGCDPIVDCPLPTVQSHYFFDWSGDVNPGSRKSYLSTAENE